MARKKQRVDVSGQSSTGFSTLGGALAGLGFVSAEQPQAEPAEPTSPEHLPDPDDLTGVRRVVMRLEKKGRRGKAVTVLDGLPTGGLDRLARDLKRTLGCGVSREDSTLVVQGDQRDRLEPLLRQRGVSKVSR